MKHNPWRVLWTGVVLGAAMADSVQYALDRMVVDLEDLRYRGIFSEVRERQKKGGEAAKSNFVVISERATSVSTAGSLVGADAQLADRYPPSR